MKPHDFYRSVTGERVKRVLEQKLQELWPSDELKDRAVICLGHTAPFQSHFIQYARNVFSFDVKADESSHHNFSFSEPEQLPLSAESVNRALLCHAFDNNMGPTRALLELWRVLKPGGRVLCVIGNVNSQWSEASSVPFKDEFCTTQKQACRLFENAQFNVLTSQEAVFMPPYETPLNLRLSGLYEGVGKYLSFIPSVGGVHIIEAEKSIRQPVPKGNAPVTQALVGKILNPKPV
jgi:SAM-dependent methyltransferase